MGVAHGTDKQLLLDHKAAIDVHLAGAGIEVGYTNVFWGGRSEIKPVRDPAVGPTSNGAPARGSTRSRCVKVECQAVRRPQPAGDHRHVNDHTPTHRPHDRTERGLRDRGRAIQAVRNVSFDLYPGETLALVGESGSGKTSIALALLGLLPSNATIEGGTVEYNGAPVPFGDESALRAIRGSEITMIFQDPQAALTPPCASATRWPRCSRPTASGRRRRMSAGSRSSDASCPSRETSRSPSRTSSPEGWRSAS